MEVSKSPVIEGCVKWIHNNTVTGNGIAVTSRHHDYYPEVTGYYIPSLLLIDEVDLAKAFAKSLCERQHKNGAWYDTEGKTPYIFDTCQILKGLVAVRTLMPEVDNHIIKAIDWVFTNQTEEGRLIQPNTDLWGKDPYWNNELIHIYCMSPIIEASKVFDIPEYAYKANKVLDYYINTFRDRIVNYSMFAHFYAYVIEGLVDCGRLDIAHEAMTNFEQYQKPDGGIFALNDVQWECTTAMFQFAITWYKLGNKERGDKTYNHVCAMQHDSGGWFGCKRAGFFDYIKGTFGRSYFQRDEISWAVKFCIDATYYKERCVDKTKQVFV